MSAFETAVGILAPDVLQNAKKVLGLNEFRLLEKELQHVTERTCKEFRKTFPHSAVAANPEGVRRTVVQCLELNKPITFDELEYGDKRVEDEDRQRFLKLLIFELNHNGAWFMRHNTAIQSQLAAAHDAKNDVQHQEMLAFLQKIDALLSGGTWARAKQNAQWLHWNSAYLRHDHDFIGHDPEDDTDIVYKTCERITAAYPFASGFAYCIAGEGGIGKTEVCREALKQTLIRYPILKALYIDATNVKAVRDLAAKIHAALGHAVEAMNEDVLPYLTQEAAEAGLLLYLDNFEDLIWGPESKEAWRWIERLSRTDHCAVLLSSREKPVDMPGDTVACLAAQAALELYRREYERGNQGKKTLLLKEEALIRPFLEKELEGHPLSIVMMAGQTCFFSVEESLHRWQELVSIEPPGDMERKSLYHSTLLTYNAMREKGWQDAINLWVLHTAFRTRTTEHTYRIVGTQQPARERLMRLGVLRREDGTYRVLNPLQEFMRQHYKEQEPKQWQTLLTDALNAYLAEQNAIADDGSMDERLRQMHEEYGHLIFVWEAYWQGRSDCDYLLNVLFANFHENCRIYQPQEFYSLAMKYTLSSNELIRAIALACIGAIDQRFGRYENAQKKLDDAETIFKKNNDLSGISNVLMIKGDLEVIKGSLKAAKKHYANAVEMFRELYDWNGVANAIISIAELEVKRDKHKEARDKYHVAERLFRIHGNRLGLANVLRCIGDLDVYEENNIEARKKYEEAENLYRDIGENLGLATLLQNIGNLDVIESDFCAAEARYNEAKQLYNNMGQEIGKINIVFFWACMLIEKGDADGLKNFLVKSVSNVPSIYSSYMHNLLKELRRMKMSNQMLDAIESLSMLTEDKT